MIFRSLLRGLLPVVALLPLCLPAALAAEEASTPPVHGMAVSVDVARDTGIGGGFICSAQVTDALSGEVLAAPTLPLAPGGRSSSRSFRHAEGDRPSTEVVVEVSSSRSGDSVSYKVSYSRAGALVGTQSSSLAIR